jgi:hypothetical protein
MKQVGANQVFYLFMMLASFINLKAIINSLGNLDFLIL